MSENAWIKLRGKKFFKDAYEFGKKQLAKDAANVDDNIID